MQSTPDDFSNAFASPASSEPAPAGPSFAPSRLGNILGRAFDCYFKQWSEWPVPLLVCGLIGIAGALACVLPGLLAQGPLICALYWCAFRNLRGWPVDTASLGRGWQLLWPGMSSNIALLLMVAVPGLAINCVMLAVLAVSGLLVPPNPPPGPPDPAAFLQFMQTMFSMALISVPLGLIGAVLQVWFETRTMFVMPLVADRGYDFLAALKQSWEATRHRFWERLLLLVLARILGTLGMYLCYVGLFFALPLQFLIIAAAYEDEFGIEGLPPPAAFPAER